MKHLLTLLQLMVIALCIWGELSTRIRSTPISTIGLGCIALAAIIGLTGGVIHSAPLLESIGWSAIALLIAAFLRRQWRKDRRRAERRQPWKPAQ